ncbi:MAG: hypothetical protein A2W00_00525 [Candidatus Eisenbacteria bacterium RBG_16_71_46]|nr:MAG: hypothetical protein A2W00_00525 [Candidatus Eisenbacteria bacterium RBG_16_71_46]
MFEVSAIRMWRSITVRASLSRAQLDFGLDDLLGTSPRLGTATCDQLRLSALFAAWSLHRSDDRRPGSSQWIVGLLGGPTVGWTRLSNLHASADGVQYAGVDRLSVDSGLQVGWESWIGGPVWFDGPLAHALLYVDMAFVGFGKDLVQIRTTPGSAVVAGASRVAPATFRVGLAYLRNLEPGHP